MYDTPKEQRLYNIICKGLEILITQLDYPQNKVLDKLMTLGSSISAATLTNIKKREKPVRNATLMPVATAMQELLRLEMDMVFDEEQQDFRLLHTPNWNAALVPEQSAQYKNGFILHDDGRVSVQEKAAFISDATREVIEVGIRLNSFSSYFIYQKESAYKSHIIALLQKGVHIKGYLLDPECNEARLYFEDRSRVQATEKESIAEIRKVITRLKTLCAEFEAMQLKGRFEIYLYRHIPYSLYLVVDGATEVGKMMISPYLYGISRANCPVMEFSKADQRVLYRRHWESAQLFMDGAQKL